MGKVEHTDQDLLALFRIEKHREEAFSILVTKYQKQLYWHIRKIVLSHQDADDILQNVFIKVWNNLLQFRKNAALYTWLYKIATNETITFIKKQKRNRLVSIDDYVNYIENKIEDEGYFTGTEIQKKLQLAILTLPEKQRIIFQMKYFEELKYAEISKILKTSVGALKASYHHAVKKIEIYLKTH